MSGSKDAAKPFGAIGLIASFALLAGGCVATLDDDFEIVAADTGTARPFADAGGTGQAVRTADAGTVGPVPEAAAATCSCKPGSVCVDDQCACAAATPKDCGAECRQCCSDSDCDDGDPCTSEVCLADGLCAPPAPCVVGQVCCPGVGCAQCCSDSDCPSERSCESNHCKKDD